MALQHSGAPASLRHRLARWRGLALETHISLPFFGLLLLGAIWIGTLHVIGAAEAVARAGAQDATRKLLAVYEAQVARSLGQIDQTLRVLQYAVEHDGAAGALPALRAKGLLPLGMVFQVDIANRDGLIVASNRQLSRQTLAGAPHFEFHRSGRQAGLYVGRTTIQSDGPQAHVHFSRRINDAHGRFAGVASVAVAPDFFTNAYDHARLGEHGLLGLAGEDGVVRALRVGDDDSFGQRLTLGQPEVITLRTGSIDQHPRYVGNGALSDFPLQAVVGLSEAEQMAGFDQQRRTWLLGSVACSTLLIAIVLMVSAWSWQLAKARRRERQAQETYAAASEASPDGFYVLRNVYDDSGTVIDFTVIDVNSRAEQLTGFTKEQLSGQLASGSLPREAADEIMEQLVAVATDGAPREAEWQTMTLGPDITWLHRQIVAVDGGVVAIVRDITGRKRAEERIRHLAHHDELTGLPNRTLLRDRLGQAIRDAERTGRSVALAFIDLDGFKLVNDGLGHNAGDELLKVVGARMAACLRRSDTLARFGGDEFVILLPDLVGEPMTIAAVLEQVRESVIRPILLDGQEVQVSCSTGVAIYPRDGGDANALMMHADAAMYSAKEQGANNVQFYAREMNDSLEEKLVLLEGLRAAIDTCALGYAAGCQFELLYQPKIDLRSGLLFGLEALLRWHHPEHGLVPPSRFISLAEESGLIIPIGEWVLRTACAQNQAWRDAGLAPVTVAVNVSARQFEEEHLVERVKDALDASELAPDGLEVEVTESLIMRDLSRSVERMRELKAMGVELSIDDFGTGYSSLAALKTFPISRLKIDKSFVSDLAESSDDQAIAMAVISLGHKLNLRVIAEGVETEQQRDFLLANDCDEVQGYLYSRPVPVREVPALLSRYAERLAA